MALADGQNLTLGPIDTHYGGKPVETIRIRLNTATGFGFINASDYDPDIHTLYDEKECINHGEDNATGIGHAGAGTEGSGTQGDQGAGRQAVASAAGNRGDRGNSASADAGRGKGSASERGERPRSGNGAGRGGKYSTAEAHGSAEGSGQEGDAATGSEGSADAGVGTD